MDTRTRPYRRLAAVALLGLLSACAGGSGGRHWVAPHYQGMDLSPFLVVVVTERWDARTAIEADVVQSLGAHESSGVASSSLDDESAGLPNRQRIVQMVQATGARGVLVIQLANIEQQDNYDARAEDLSRIQSYYRQGMTGYLADPRVNPMEQQRRETTVTLAVRLFDVASEELIWWMPVTSTKVGDPEGFAGDIARGIAGQMARDDLI